ncbi:phosphofructokinase, putative [Eimeria acervulina]|uniref:Probable ATP-dependent 6-phosphofructokinase n=1 Tax=Eimeria acervulina TaxID=5801 RepID=U6G9T9_EIMAC|nr:phosphofructokinase, putative [Eimeria acervulina]CDI76905.1 phosphofructokinase, putative [Eimeria acervulina]
MPGERLPLGGQGAHKTTNAPPLPAHRSPSGRPGGGALPTGAGGAAGAAAAAGGVGAGVGLPAHLRRGRSLLVLTQDNQYKLSAPPADPHGARSPSRDAWRPTITTGPAQSPKTPGERELVAPASGAPQAARQQQGSRPVKRFSFRAGVGLSIDARSRQLSRRLSSFGMTEGNVFGSLATNAPSEAPPSVDAVLKEQETNGKVHLHSADLFERSSPLQRLRRAWRCTLPSALESTQLRLVEADCPVEHPSLRQTPEVQQQLRGFFPATFGKKYVEVVPGMGSGVASPKEPLDHPLSKALRIGIVLSGGPAPGGHNVIAGLYDFVKQKHPESMLVGFMGGLDGVMNQNYTVVTEELMEDFRNQGGFDMLWSGRGRVGGEEDIQRAREVCESLELHGFVLVGGDGSNSNAALLAESFEKDLPSCCVIGVPKTIDGDLKNALIEASFGFDTAAKTYSELIGNLCIDVNSSQKVYHFVRVMGRSASHLVLECAMQARPNLVFIGEEVERENMSLEHIVQELVDLVVKRAEQGKMYGVILVPEGLIEFIPEMKQLIKELNSVLKAGQPFKPELLKTTRAVWDFLPDVIQDQLLMDRESTGYIQVAKIATERLLILLLENELVKQGKDPEQWSFMPHYFGYEGRCAMPSNFDANYCYSLGFVAGVPFTTMMCVKEDAKGVAFPAITRSLVDLDGPLFKVFCEAREHWKFGDYYRVPGPIQFEGPTADEPAYAVSIPTKEELLHQSEAICHVGVGGRVVKSFGFLSALQRERLTHRPPVPPLCLDPKCKARPMKQVLCKDPYTQRQVLMHYPYLANSTLFYLHEVAHDKYTPPINYGLRVGFVLLSRQSPGVMNVLWGLHERLKMVQGKCLAFFGLTGLIEKNYIEITDENLELFLNQGGCELTGRSTSHCLGSVENQEAVRQRCEELMLDGLVMPGSAFAMSEAALVAEYFLARQCRTSIIGIPATGSNNLAGEFIETCVGFDSSTKVYAALIGNVLTDAASMPKYWHFIRLMGRQPSFEVLECALQTHPNVVIIAEEYGAADKTLLHVVQDIADVVCRRAELGRNFGTVLIPDALLMHLPNMKILLAELRRIIREAQAKGEMKKAQVSQQLMDVDSWAANEPDSWNWRLTPWSAALFKTFPKFIRRELVQVDMGEIRFERLETEELLAQMVKEELEYRASVGRYCGKFQAVTHFFGYQGRSSMPSTFDANLAYAYGNLASILVESGVTGHCCSIRGLCGNPKEWHLGSVPFVSLMRLVPNVQDNPTLTAATQKTGTSAADGVMDRTSRTPSVTEQPVIPSSEVSLDGKAYRWMKTALEQWMMEDRFCNPGPIQFYGASPDMRRQPPCVGATFFNRVLYEEQAEYFDMVRRVECYTNILRNTCSFGVSDHILKHAFVSLTGLLMLVFHSDELTTRMPALGQSDETDFTDVEPAALRKTTWRDQGGQLGRPSSSSKHPGN